MVSLDDKLLGEKIHNYCSSSEDEGSGDESGSDNEEIQTAKVEKANEEPPVNKWTGTANNTGPKGVLEDWRRFKQLEVENRNEMAKERLALAKKLTLSVKTDREEQMDKNADEIEEELNELVDEDFLMQYQKQRMQELMLQLKKTPQFGKVFTLNSKQEFLDAIDKEDQKVTVIIHIYNNNTLACETMSGCLEVLAKEYPMVKFCQILTDITGMSQHFRVEGVPALLVYKSGQIIGNFVQLVTELGNDFFAVDVERFLIEFGMIPEK